MSLTSESTLLKERKARAQKIARVLKTLFKGREGTALNYTTPWELLVAVVLSAQSRDVLVNLITKDFFRLYPTIQSCAEAEYEKFDQALSKINYHKTKAKNIIASAQMIQDKFNGQVPATIEELMRLPGVGRKSANVITSNAFSVNYGIAVDTHVRRFALKFDLTTHTDPVKIEQDLMKLLPKSEWFAFHNNLIFYGREICPARPHECAEHPLTKIYPSAASVWPKAK